MHVVASFNTSAVFSSRVFGSGRQVGVAVACVRGLLTGGGGATTAEAADEEEEEEEGTGGGPGLVGSQSLAEACLSSTFLCAFKRSRSLRVNEGSTGIGFLEGAGVLDFNTKGTGFLAGGSGVGSSAQSGVG